MSHLAQTPVNSSLFDFSKHPAPAVDLLSDGQWSYIKKRYLMTDREFQVAKLICSGLNNEDIAHRLNIRHGTVKTHIRNIYRKTWVHNKVSMLLRFLNDIKVLSG